MNEPYTSTTAGEGSLSGDRFVFIIGAPRSGTTWLNRMLAAHNGIAGLPYEITLFARYVPPLINTYQLELEKQEADRIQRLPTLIDAQAYQSLVRDFVDAIHGRVLATKPQASVILDKHPGNTHHLDVIERLLPGARYIHLLRDGRDVAVSMLRVSDMLGKSAASLHNCATEWANCVKRARAHGQRVGPGRYMELRYEDLVDRTQEQLAAVFTFCGHEVPASGLLAIAEQHHFSHNLMSRGDSSVDAFRGNKGGVWRLRLSLSQRYLFDRVAGSWLRATGYADARWWALGPLDRLRMAFYPLRVKIAETLRLTYGTWSRPIVRAVEK